MSRAGQFDRRITIEQPTETRDLVGDPITAWSEFATRWARKIDRRGTERFQAERETAEREVLFEIRYLAGVNETMRILFDGDTYDIEEVLEVRRRQFQTIRGVAKVA